MTVLLTRQLICGIPELGTHAGSGARHVLSILDPEEPDPDAFVGYPAHERVTLRFHDIIEPIDGMVAPQPEHVAAVLRLGRELGPDGLATLLIHCHAGVSRSTAAAAMLLAQAHPDVDEASLFRHIEQARPQAWPNSRMMRFADEQLGRGGRLTAGLRTLYARRLAAQPGLGEELLAGGRGLEVNAAR